MFVDIVSFGQLAAALQPDEVLTKLSKRLDEITKIIHQFGGSVDRSLGDGILCFFGYGAAVQSNKHALDAFNAAVKIQQNTVDFSNKVGEDGSDRQENFPLPVRIGMHTDTVTIGNLGSDQAVDFTMVGSGVNFTSQLESACAPFKIMLSESCRQQLLLDGVDRDQFQSILFSLKNKVDLVNAYEVNPFAHDPTRMNLSVKMYRKQLGESSREDRFRVVGVPDIFLVSSSASFRVVDFSPRGFQVVSSAFLAQKSVVEVSIDTQNPELDLKLSEKLMRDLTVEVRWSRKNGREFLHGMRLLGGAESQWHFLMEVLVEAARGDKASLQPLNNEVPDDFPDDLDVA
jgi:class 3 adenylate cyclase